VQGAALCGDDIRAGSWTWISGWREPPALAANDAGARLSGRSQPVATTRAPHHLTMSPGGSRGIRIELDRIPADESVAIRSLDAQAVLHALPQGWGRAARGVAA